MKKIYLIIFAFFVFLHASAVQHTIVISGNSYSPATVNAAVGDTINFPASGTHPIVQVDQTTWNANGNSPMAGGWGVSTSGFQYQILFAGDIYFVCQAHASIGMKGRVLVTVSNVAEMIGQNNVELLSNIVNYNEVTVMNSTDRSGELNVFDLSGKLLETYTISKEAKQQVEIVQPKGVYIYRFNMQGLWTKSDKLYIARD